MDERILEFVGDLRRAELRISPTDAVSKWRTPALTSCSTIRRSGFAFTA